MVSRACLTCGKVIPRGPRCADCTSALNIARGSSTIRGYHARWRRISERKRRLTPYCELRYPGCQRIAVDVDHVRPIRAGGRAIWSNAQSTCRPCHAFKTAADKERYPDVA